MQFLRGLRPNAAQQRHTDRADAPQHAALEWMLGFSACSCKSHRFFGRVCLEVALASIVVNLPGWCWAEIQQFALVGSSSSLHSEACNALGASDGVIHSSISHEVGCMRASTNAMPQKKKQRATWAAEVEAEFDVGSGKVPARMSLC